MQIYALPFSNTLTLHIISISKSLLLNLFFSEHINSKDINKRGIDLSFKIDNVIYKKEFCSKVFYEKMICAEENKFNNKDLEMDIICSVKVFENGRAYICIEDCESRIIK